MATTTFGKYQLIAELGHGGMADVFLAVQAGPAGSGFRKLTVLKRLRQNLADEPEFVAMLVDEARIAARLNHPNVVQTNEVGEVGNQYFIAMEYLDGQPLHRIQHRAAQRAKDGAPMPLTADQQYLIIMDALAGLHHAHELVDYDGTPLDIVHRDITPHNIFVTYTGQTKVVDFGIAKAAGRASETRQGVVKGKVRYMAPEQAVGKNIDRRSDIFAAGVMLWEAASNKRLWKGREELEIVQALISGNIPSSPKAVTPEVPDAIDRICQKALAARPEDRYATAEQFRSDLEQYLVESGKLVETRRSLAPMISDLFKDKRAEIRNVIEKQIALIEESPSNPNSAPRLEFESSQSAVKSLSGSGTRSMSLDSATNMTAPPVEPTAKKPSSVVVVSSALLAAVVAIGLVVWKTRPAAATDAKAPTTVSAATTHAETTGNKVSEIVVKVTATPANARVRVDDGPEEALPLELKVPRDDRDHTFTFTATDYAERTEHVKFVRDMNVAIELRRNSKQANAGSLTAPPVGRFPSTTATAKPDPQPTAQKVEPTAAAPTTTPTAKPEPSGKNRNLAIDNNDPWANK